MPKLTVHEVDDLVDQDQVVEAAEGVTYRESEDDLVDKEPEEEYEYRETINVLGFPQYEVAGGDGRWHDVCAQCHAMTMPNRGQGTCCDACQHQDLLECRHEDDYRLSVREAAVELINYDDEHWNRSNGHGD